MGAPLPMVAGAVVSGAYFGDKMSPLSDTTNLAPIAAGSKLYDHIGHMFYTTIPGCIICIIVYTIAGFSAKRWRYCGNTGKSRNNIDNIREPVSV